MDKYILKMYVTGASSNSERAIANLKILFDDDLKVEYELTVVNVLDNPQLAEDDRILATPTRIKELPLPLWRVIGDLSDKGKIVSTQAEIDRVGDLSRGPSV